MMAKLYSGTSWALSFLTLVLQVRKTQKKPLPGNFPDRGTNPGLLHDRHACKHQKVKRVHSTIHRGQTGKCQKEDGNRGISQAVRKLADDWERCFLKRVQIIYILNGVKCVLTFNNN